MNNPSPVDHDKLGNTVYAALCDALIRGQMQPGDRLKIRDLAEQLGTSVTPVRDAVLRLVHDDAIVFRSARDIRIPFLTEPRYLEIRNIRIRLESLAAETAAQVATGRHIAELEQIVAENEVAIQNQDRLRGTELNQKFHFALATIAGLPILHNLLRRIWLQMGPVIADSYLHGGRTMIDYHYPVIEAIRYRNSDAAAAAIIDDIKLGGRQIHERIRNKTADADGG